jgi:hypothetical protein
MDEATRVTGRGAWGGIEHVSAIRTATLTVWLAIVAATPYESYAELPRGLITPVGVGRAFLSSQAMLDVVWTAGVLVTTKWLTVTACVVAIVWPKSNAWTIPTVCLGVVFLEAVTKSLGGFVNHAQVAPLLFLVILTAFHRCRFVAPRWLQRATGASGLPRCATDDGSHESIVWLLSSAIVLPYMYIGINRVWTGGIELFGSDALLWHLAGASRGFTTYNVPFQFESIGWILNLGFLVMTLGEVTSIMLIVWPPSRIYWLIVMSVFHVAIVFLMNIVFWENLVLLWMVFGGVPRRSRAAAQSGRA